MVFAIVEHFLNDDGRRYFAAWVQHVAKVVATNESAISVARVTGINARNRRYEPERCIVEVRAASLQGLIDWIATEQHRSIVALLEHYVLQERRTSIYECSETECEKGG